MIYVSSLQICVYKMWCSMKSYSVQYYCACFKQHHNQFYAYLSEYATSCHIILHGKLKFYYLNTKPIWRVMQHDQCSAHSARNVAGQITCSKHCTRHRCFLAIGHILAGDLAFKLKCLLLLCTYIVHDHMHLWIGVSSVKTASVNYIIRQAYPK